MMMLELCQSGEGDNCRFKVMLKRRLCSLGGGDQEDQSRAPPLAVVRGTSLWGMQG